MESHARTQSPPDQRSPTFGTGDQLRRRQFFHRLSGGRGGGGGAGFRMIQARSIQAHLRLCSPVPNTPRPVPVLGPRPGGWRPCSRPQCPDLCTTDVWAAEFLAWRAVLCTAGCFRASPASTHWMSGAPQVVTTKRVAGHCPVTQGSKPPRPGRNLLLRGGADWTCQWTGLQRGGS